MFGGISIAVAEVISGVIFFIIIIGISFGNQQFKLVVSAFMSFASYIIDCEGQFESYRMDESTLV